MVNNDIYKEILTKLLKVSELKMSTEVTVRNTVLSETDLKITGTLTVRNMVLSKPDLKMTGTLTVRNMVLSEPDLKMTGTLTVRNMVLSNTEGNKLFLVSIGSLKEHLGFPWFVDTVTKGAIGLMSVGPGGIYKEISCHLETKWGGLPA